VRDGRRSSRDRGFTLIELLIVISLLGVIMATLSTAIVVILRSTPSTGLRIDDARTLRGMSTWLSFDVTSTPPFMPEDSNGGIDTAAGRNDCGAPGTNILHLSWTEYDGSATRTFASSYRYINEPGNARMMRYTCSRTGTTAPFGAVQGIKLTSGLSEAQSPVALFDTAAGRVTVVKLRLSGASGEQVIVDTSSRNPAAFLP
jgi:prepilin-type N-terminal cleavage/methylation domain-containing protein